MVALSNASSLSLIFMPVPTGESSHGDNEDCRTIEKNPNRFQADLRSDVWLRLGISGSVDKIIEWGGP